MAAPTSRAPAVPRLRLSAGSIAISTASLLAVGAILPGVLVRVFHVFSADFPLNDGGLFYVMARDLQANNYFLPGQTSYNHEAIPFAYPPVAIYVAALVDELTPFSLTTVFRLLPLLFSALTLVAFLQLARRMLRSELAALAAVIAFGLIPRSFIWMLMGTGLTRSLSDPSRQAMSWVSHSTPSDARFLVMPTRSWEVGRESEWFAALTSCTSVATVQRSEWLPDRAFDRAIDDYNGLWACGGADAECLEDWSAATGKAFTHVYLPDGCCAALEEDLQSSMTYHKVYDRDGQVIFEYLRT